MVSAAQCLLGALLSMVISHTAWGYQEELNSAKNLLAQGENQRAYSQLQAIELDNSGEPEFDYWLGVAALRAGESSHALMALERTILRQPSHAGARMERVAALVQLDQLSGAEREIEQLQALSPPSEAQAAIARFETLIEQRRQAKQGSNHQAILGVDIGYDSNPQRSQDQFYINLIPGLTTPVLISERSSSLYQRLQGSYQGTFAINTQSRWRLSTTSQTQRYVSEAAQDYDLTIAQGQVGYERDLEAQRTVTINGSALQGWSGRSQHRLLTRWGSSVDLRHPVGVDSELTWQFDAQHNRFKSANNNYNSGLLGVLLSTQHSALRTRLNAQIEHEWAAGHRDGGDLLRLVLGATVDYPLGNRHLIRANLNHRIQTYQDEGFAFYNNFAPTTRRDRLWQARLSWLHQLSTDWLVEASGDIERRHSSINFFDTRRYQTQLALRYLF